ncbi:MAG: cytochrome b N-terminal domain-containing protein [Candidatus Methylomirabilales bacterium]
MATGETVERAGNPALQIARGAWGWIDSRLGLRALTYHVPAYANRLPYLLGGITLVGIVILIGTGIYLAQFYHPDPADAHASMIYIINEAQLGDFLRGVHYWTSNIVVVTLLFHIGRVLIWGAYRAPREVTWLAGIGLLVVMMGLFFTGTVLKWDQEAFEALAHNEEIGNLLGGLGAWFTTEFSRGTSLLSRVYTAHVTILPALLTLVVAAHLLLVRHHGIAPRPGEKEEEVKEEVRAAELGQPAVEVSHFDVHLRKIAGYGLLLTAVAIVLALLLSPPLGPPPIPGEEVTKPPWVFIWLYPFENWWGLTALLWIPIGLVLALAVIPFLDRTPFKSLRKRWLLLFLVAAVFAAIVAFGFYGRVITPAAHLVE